MIVSKLRTMFARVAFVAVTLASVPSFGQEDKAPQTVAEHEARAQAYTKEATQYRQAAEEQSQMAREYKQQPTGRGKNPWGDKMEKHSKALAKDYEKLATDAEKAADYHMMRAKEMQGK